MKRRNKQTTVNDVKVPANTDTAQADLHKCVGCVILASICLYVLMQPCSSPSEPPVIDDPGCAQGPQHFATILQPWVQNPELQASKSFSKPFSALTDEDKAVTLVLHVSENLVPIHLNESGFHKPPLLTADFITAFHEIYTRDAPQEALDFLIGCSPWHVLMEMSNRFAIVYMKTGMRHFDWAKRIQHQYFHKNGRLFDLVPEIVTCVELISAKRTPPDDDLNDANARAHILSECFGDLFLADTVDRFTSYVPSFGDAPPNAVWIV